MYNKECIYPWFLDVCLIVEDEFYKNIFENLGYGIPPSGTYIAKKLVLVNKIGVQSDYLCCGLKDKEFSYKLERKPKEILYTDIKDLCKNKLGLISFEEKTMKEQSFNNWTKLDNKDSWAKINKKSIKDVLYEKYALELKEKHNLSVKDTKFFLSLLSLAMIFKTITSKDITYSDGKITNIDGFTILSEGKDRVVCNRNIFKTVSQPDVKKPPKTVFDYWNKHCEKLFKISA